MKNILFFFPLSLFYSFLLFGQTTPFELNTPFPKSYVAFKTTEVISIDGILDERAWDMAPWTDPFVDIEGGKTPKYTTQMKILWDENYLYFMAKLEEPHVWGTLKQRDTVIFYNNDFEIFIDPDGDTHNYVEFEMNVLNTVWDLFLTAPYRNNPKVLNQWDMKGILSAVSIQGTLNNPSDIDRGWQLEVAIPRTVFNEVTQMNDHLAGEFWRMGFSRVNWDFDISQGQYYRKKGPDGNYLPEYNWVWSEQRVINMHEPEKWGYVYFSPRAPGENDSFAIPDQEYLKWFMYQEYRKLLIHFKSGEGWSKDQMNISTHIKGKQINLKLIPYLNGFNLLCDSPFSELTLEINTSGKFKSYETNTP